MALLFVRDYVIFASSLVPEYRNRSVPVNTHVSPLAVTPRKSGILFRVARFSLLALTPLVWLGGVYGAFLGGNFVVLNHRVCDLPSFIFCIVVSPVAALLAGFAIWILFVAPFQFIGWLLDRGHERFGWLRRIIFRRPKSFLDPRI